MAETARYGSWASPIHSDALTARVVTLSQPELDGRDIYWLERRPDEGGRTALMRLSDLNALEEILPAPWNVNSRVHEYGGGAYTVHKGTIYFVNDADQRLYRIKPGKAPFPLTPESDRKLRYADLAVDAQRGLLYCVREDHRLVGTDRIEAENSIVAIDLKNGGGEGRVVASGSDFYASPRLSPDDSRLCWLSWNHPNMPWDGCELWMADLDEGGNIFKLHQVAGSPNEAVFQPCWSPDGTLYYVSDRTHWWNLYRSRDGHEESIYPMNAEFGDAAWVFGLSTYGFETSRRIVCSYRQGIRTHLAFLDTNTLRLNSIETDLTEIAFVRCSENQFVFLGGSPATRWTLYSYDFNSRVQRVIRAAGETEVDLAYASIPEHIEFPAADGTFAHGHFYPPRNPEFSGPSDEKPPLLVMSHGGPTSRTATVYRENVTFFTSRGIAVLDVDYGGSTGYGRVYRRRLAGKWGIVDVDDCVNGALYLVERGLVDPDRMAIKGGSAGGYTTLCALTFRDVFKAGVSYYGVADLEALARDTHKFESRYLNTLVGHYPEMQAEYIARSPIHHTGKLSCAIILFQGREDPVVSPAQSEQMYQALVEKHLPVAYLLFDGEAHGFRRAENIRRAIEAELYFLSRIFGFTPADEIEPVEIKNLAESES